MADLTTDELRRIQKTLRARYLPNSQGNILDVGFGVAIEAGQCRPQRGLCITFLVQAKQTPEQLRDRIPTKVDVRVKRGRRFLQCSFGTDVVEVGQIERCGSRLDYRNNNVTTGVIVAWQGLSSRSLLWGVLTVGHLFPRLRSLSHARRQVTIRTGRTKFAGTLIAKSDGDRAIDAAIAAVDRQDLLAARLLDAAQSSQRITPRKLTRLQADQNKIGLTQRVSDERPFTVHAYFPSLRVAGMGTVRHTISVLASAAHTFAKGTSGSSWLVQSQAACLQVAGRSPDFRQGFGQSLETVADWAAQELRSHNLMRPDSFRLVSVF